MTDLQEQLYLIADEMRNLATLTKNYAKSSYDTENAQKMMGLAVRIAALADDQPEAVIKSIFEAEPWQRYSAAGLRLLQPSGFPSSPISTTRSGSDGRAATPERPTAVTTAAGSAIGAPTSG